MARRALALALAVLAALLAVGLAGCSGAAGVVSVWGGGTAFDRTPGAVMARFNELAASWGELRGSDDEPGIPPIGSATLDADGAFSFVPAANSPSGQATEFENECSRFSISGAAELPGGKVNRLMLRIDCTLDKVTPSYLTNCDRLMQLALFSLFGTLDDKQSRDLSLLFVYDIRPFNARSVDISLPDNEKRAQCVMNGQLIEFTATVSQGSHISMQADFTGAATGVQIGEDTENANCNRKLSQANTECTELSESTSNLSSEIEQDTPDWVELQAIADQLSESISVIEELCVLLRQHAKSREYASRLSVHLNEFKQMNALLAIGIRNKDIDSIAELQSPLEDSSGMMQFLISMMLA